MGFVNEIKGIVEAFGNTVNKTEVVEAIALKRREICSVCPSKKYDQCSECGCNILMMSRALTKKSCPLNKWKKAQTDSSGLNLVEDGLPK